jgi:DNA-binding response OmpR family regulator
MKPDGDDSAATTVRRGQYGEGKGRGMGASVLVIEDERKIRQLLRSYLEHDGLSVLTTGSGAEGLRIARESEPDLVLLDLGLPDVPGEEVLRELRDRTRVPVLVLTARGETGDRIRGLELGADDYVTKPFSPREVVLRARAVLRRAGAVSSGAVRFGQGRLAIHPHHRSAHLDGRPLTLTPSEWGVLTTLADAPGRVFSRGELVSRIRGYAFEGDERIIDTHVKNLRRKLDAAADSGTEQVVETVLGAGYRLALPRDRD